MSARIPTAPRCVAPCAFPARRRARRPNPAAHGNITEVCICRCGAEKRININQEHIERGAWLCWAEDNAATVEVR